MFGFLVKQQKLSWSFLNQIHSYYLATPPRGVLPYENVGGACWKGTKNLFCGRSLDFIYTPKRYHFC